MEFFNYSDEKKKRKKNSNTTTTLSLSLYIYIYIYVQVLVQISNINHHNMTEIHLLHCPCRQLPLAKQFLAASIMIRTRIKFSIEAAYKDERIT
jgi:hypothetical protein